MHGMEWYGNEGLALANASGLAIKLVEGTALTFLSFVETGDQTLTFQEQADGASAQAFPVITRAWKAPAVAGAPAVLIEQAAANTVVNADAVNDQLSVTILGEQLSDGYDEVICTAGSGILVAVLHSLHNRRSPRHFATLSPN